jgi:hypothetical protein
MNLLKKINRGRNFRFFSLCPVIFVILFLNSCKQKPEPYQISEFTGDEAIYNFTKSQTLFTYSSDSLNPAVVLADYGDLFFLGSAPYIYSKSSGTTIHFKSSRDAEFVNSKISTLYLPRKKDFAQWVKLVDTADLSELQFLSIDSLIPENIYPYLTKIAEKKPATGIIYNSDLSEISALIKLFNPRYLIGGSIQSKDSGIISAMTNLELLAIAFDDSVNNFSLPPMPKLKQLLITGVNQKLVLNDKLLLENKSIEELSIMELKTVDFSMLSPLTNLRELSLTDFDTIINPGLLANHKNLEVLTIMSDGPKDSVMTHGLSALRWITFPPKIKQDDFNAVIESQPDLEVAVMVKNEKISSLASLLKLKKLNALLISDTITDPATVKSMKNLKFLSLPASVLKDSSARAEWHKLLPDTRISSNEGFCLGSGWLLLIIPLSLFFFALSQRKINKPDATS